MKKALLVGVIVVGTIFRTYAQEIDEPLTDPTLLGYANKSTIGSLQNFDLKTIVYNGNLEFLEGLLSLGQLDVIALGTLDNNELRLLRNSIYAKHNYKFKSTELSEHFEKFPWYRPQFDTVDSRLTNFEKQFVSQIQLYEDGYVASSPQKVNVVGLWEEFNGGADQVASSIDIRTGGSFLYIYGESFSRKILSIAGQWEYSGRMLNLKVRQLSVRIGGYYVLVPSGYELKDSQTCTLLVEGRLQAQIPVSSITMPKNYPKGNWLSIGGISMRKIE